MSITENNKRIAKNTIFLYIRMFVMMAVSLYTSRVVLKSLGVEDFGIYNVVAGITVLFSFLNGAMSIASQRFMSFSIGKDNDESVNKVFSMSLTAHLAIAFFVFVVAETFGLWLLWKMNFPESRYDAISWTYQLAVLTCMLRIVRVPYNASIIAYERMSFYAWISIIEGFLTLSIALLLMLSDNDKLIFYSFLILVVAVLINVIYYVYCKRYFYACKYKFFWDKNIFKKYIYFSGWSLAGSLANIGAHQGLNMIINIFCGVSVNASVGISNQVMTAVGKFLTNFQTAFNPQLVKSYAMGEKEYFMKLIFKSSKFSYYLMFLISLPVIINCSFFLQVWLGEVPKYASEFSQLMIIFLLIDAISGPLWISVQATGKIKNYQLLMAVLIMLNIPFTYVVLTLGFSPVYVFVGRVVINLITLIARIIYLNTLIGLKIKYFIKDVLNFIGLVTICSLPIPLCINTTLEKNWVNIVFISSICLLTTMLSIYFLGLTKGEKNLVVNVISKKIIRR